MNVVVNWLRTHNGSDYKCSGQCGLTPLKDVLDLLLPHSKKIWDVICFKLNALLISCPNVKQE